MLQTHFAKTPLKNRQFDSALQSVIYNALPSDKLVTKEVVINCIKNNKEFSFKTEKAILDSFKNMIDEGFIKELHGFFLEKQLGLR